MAFAGKSKRDDHLVPSIHKNNLILVQVGTIRTRTSITSFTLTNHTPKTMIAESSSLSRNESLSQQEPLSEYNTMDKNNTESNNKAGHLDNLGGGNADTNDGQKGSLSRKSPSPPAPPPRSSFQRKKKRVRVFQSQWITPIRPSQRNRDAKASKPAASATAARTMPTAAGSRKRKACLSDKKMQQREHQQQQYQSGTLDSIGISHISFPIRLRMVIEKCELEQAQRRNNRKPIGTTTAKKQKKDDCCSADDPSTNDKQNEKNKMATYDRAIIGWTFNGRSFKIYDEERFVREIMPAYFVERSGRKSRDQVSIKDFQKSLSLWGFTDMPCVEGPFTRITHTCSHPSFLRDDLHASSALHYWKSIVPVTE